MFLQAAWTNVIVEGDTEWIERVIADSKARPQGPGAGAGPALERMLAAGATPEDIAEVVRVLQWQTLSGLAYQLSDPGVVEYPSNDLPRMNWALFRLGDDDEPAEELGGLHESLLGTEPSGREMRPRAVAPDR